MRLYLYNIFKKILFTLVILSLLVSCKQKPADSSYKSTIEENVTYEESTYEKIIYEDVTYEELLYEELTEEFLTFEEILEELVISEDISLEDLIVEYASIEDIKNGKLLSQTVLPDIDWATMAAKYAVGTSVVVFTAVLSVATSGTPVACVFMRAFQGSVKGALSGAVTGAAINAGIGALTSNGDVNTMQKYAIEGSADGFMWGAIFGAVSGGLKGYKEFNNSYASLDKPKSPIKNKVDGLNREKNIYDKLTRKYQESDGFKIESEVYLRDKSGKIVKDSITGEARRIDFVVTQDKKVISSIEVTSKTADKTKQIAKENRIRSAGGNYIQTSNGELIKISKHIITFIERLK